MSFREFRYLKRLMKCDAVKKDATKVSPDENLKNCLLTLTWVGCLSANETSSEHHWDIMPKADTGQSRQEALGNSDD